MLPQKANKVMDAGLEPESVATHVKKVDISTDAVAMESISLNLL